MSALIFIVDTLLSLALFVVPGTTFVCSGRAPTSATRLPQAVVRLTNPVILPLRRILPRSGKSTPPRWWLLCSSRSSKSEFCSHCAATAHLECSCGCRALQLT